MNSQNQYLFSDIDCQKAFNDINNQLDGKSKCTNSGFNFGQSTRLYYDNDCANDYIEQSTAPFQSVVDPNRIKNCDQCLSLNGPIPGHNGWGNNIPILNPGVDPAQELIDIDSIMSNRNVKTTRARRGMVNDIDVFKFKTYDCKLCDKGLDPLSSILTYPKQLYRELSINRFYDLNINPQVNIYWNKAVNSQLEAKDNYKIPYPFSIENGDELPTELQGQNLPCKTICPGNCHTNVPLQQLKDYGRK
jgi:hypothetical protein